MLNAKDLHRLLGMWGIIDQPLTPKRGRAGFVQEHMEMWLL